MKVGISISRLHVLLQGSPSGLHEPTVKTSLKVDSSEVDKQPRLRRRSDSGLLGTVATSDHL